nr:putative reverse transcriptase domain-containing protein [Tanacetum cinerariifolium]
MEEMLYKFIDKGKREHEEMRSFICEFQTTNELLFKERNNSLSELMFEVQELLKVINNTPMTNCEIKGVATSGGKKTTHDVQTNSTNIHVEEPLVVNHDKRVKSNEVLNKDKSQTSNGPIIQPSSETTQSTIDKSDLFLLKGLEKLINQSDLESSECFGSKANDDSDLRKPIQRIDYVNMPYSVAQETARPDKVKSEHLYLASANEINEKKPELINLPRHLEYAYLHDDKSFPIIISSKLSEKEKMLPLHVLVKRKGEIAWKISNIKGISPSYCTHKILMEEDFKPVIQPQRHLNP